MNKLKSYIANMSLLELVYPSTLVILAILALTAFGFSLRFLSGEINRTLVVDTPGSSLVIDTEKYAVVAHHIGLSEIDFAGGAEADISDAATTISEVQVPTTAAEIVPESLDKDQLSIAVYNATEIAGLAGALTVRLEEDGFVVKKTGNAEARTTNVIKIKESKKAYLPLLKTVLGSDFDIENAETLPEDASYDCVLIIGKELK